jgi:molecular chaperone GrpE (heat shock protein)
LIHGAEGEYVGRAGASAQARFSRRGGLGHEAWWKTCRKDVRHLFRGAHFALCTSFRLANRWRDRYAIDRRMRSWLSRWLREHDGGETPRALAADDAALPELVDLMRKSARAQARVAAKLDAMQAAWHGALAELREAVAPARAASAAAGPGRDDLLDALDTLDHVVASLGAADAASVAEGLRAVAGKLARVLSQGSLERVGAPGMSVDGRSMRVVGTEDRPDLPDGVVSRVVRAAVVSGGRVVREGEVFVNRRSSS